MESSSPDDLLSQVASRVTDPFARALRATKTLEPLAGPSGTVAPSTHLKDKKATYLVNDRRHPVTGEMVPTAVLDTPQSCANRVETALRSARDEIGFPYPELAVDVPGYGRLDVLDMPHRVADAALRDSEINGVEFFQTDVGAAVAAATPGDATALFTHSPMSIIAGVWRSRRTKAGTFEGDGPKAEHPDAKFPRAYVAETVAYGFKPIDRAAVRFDPLGLNLTKVPVWVAAAGGWTLDPEKAEKDKKNKPVPYPVKPGSDAAALSGIGHGNVPTYSEKLGGGTTELVTASTVVDFARLRRVRFPVDGVHDPDRDRYARAALTLLSVAGDMLAMTDLSLRVGCELVCVEQTWEFLASDGTTEVIQHDFDAVRAALDAALDECASRGLPRWDATSVITDAVPSLIDALRATREQLAVKEEGEAA